MAATAADPTPSFTGVSGWLVFIVGVVWGKKTLPLNRSSIGVLFPNTALFRLSLFISIATSTGSRLRLDAVTYESSSTSLERLADFFLKRSVINDWGNKKQE